MQRNASKLLLGNLAYSCKSTSRPESDTSQSSVLPMNAEILIRLTGFECRDCCVTLSFVEAIPNLPFHVCFGMYVLRKTVSLSKTVQ